MLIISAATDKLGQLLMSGTMTYLFANMLLDSKLQGVFSSLLIAPLVAISIGGVFVSRKFGLKRTFLVGTWGSMIMLAVMFVIRPNPEVPAVFLALFLVQKCLASMGNSGIIPMIADCTDYETYRSGRFVHDGNHVLLHRQDHFLLLRHDPGLRADPGGCGKCGD